MEEELSTTGESYATQIIENVLSSLESKDFELTIAPLEVARRWD